MYQHEAGHVQRQQTPPLEHPGYLLVGDALGKPFGQRGLAHARLPHKAGVVLLAAAQDLYHPVQLFLPAEHRVQLAVRARRVKSRQYLSLARLPRGSDDAERGWMGRMNCPEAGGTPAPPR